MHGQYATKNEKYKDSEHSGKILIKSQFTSIFTYPFKSMVQDLNLLALRHTTLDLHTHAHTHTHIHTHMHTHTHTHTHTHAHTHTLVLS